MKEYRAIVTDTLTLKIFEPLVSTLGMQDTVSPETLSSILLPFLVLPVFLIVNHLIREIYNAIFSGHNGGGNGGQQTRKPTPTAPGGANTIGGKASTPEDCLGIVGASGSGKTALFYYLFTGQMRETVSSI